VAEKEKERSIRMNSRTENEQKMRSMQRMKRTMRLLRKPMTNTPPQRSNGKRKERM
jgi:hypothetical protein